MDASAGLTLRESDHTYWLNGQRVPGVTECLKPLIDLSRIPPDTLERARQEGVAVHKMAELHHAGDLDVESLPDWMRGHYAALLLFLEQSGFQAWASEHKVYHPKLCFAGTFDLLGMFTRGDYAGEPSIVDLKRSFYAGPAIGAQLAAYVHAWNEGSPRGDSRKVSGRYALQLRPDGTYRLRAYTDKSDFTTFLACLTLWRAKVEIYKEEIPA